MIDTTSAPIPVVFIDLEDDQVLAETITDDGRVWLWILARGVGAEGAPDRVDAPHEELGRLPYEYRRRLAWDKPRCAATKANGRPCTAPPAPGGELCQIHRKMAAGIRCGALGKTTGRPCAVVVDHEGERCPKHRGQVTQTPDDGPQAGQGALFD